MNTWQGTGNVATAPILRLTTSSGIPVINFNIGIRENGKDRETTFVNITAWDKLADACNKYVHKGDFLVIKGHLRSRSYVDKDNIKRLQYYIEAEQIEFDPRNTASKTNAAVNSANSSTADENQNQSSESAPFGEQPVNQYEEDIPF